ncbi:MAG: hypothetical protein QXT73_00390 [Candidatus Methanomethylicaceae archaeon]
MKIEIKKYWVEVGGTPIPPNVPVLPQNGGKLELVTRLESTARGNFARWKVGEEAWAALNRARFRPVLRAEVSWFVWGPAGELRSPWGIWDPEPDEVVQLGSGLINWRARVARRLPDPLRDLLEIAAGIADWTAGGRQGHFEWTCWPLEEFPCGFWKPWGTLLNHTVCGGTTVAYRVIETGEWGLPHLVGALEMLEDGLVMSLDHKPERIGMGRYVIRHPFPLGNVD